MALSGSAYAWVGAAGSVPGEPVFHHNRAERGGAIAASAGNERYAQARVYLFTAYPDHPMTLSENIAERGGAVYGIGQAGGGEAFLCIDHTSMIANTAARGAAVLADTDNVPGLAGRRAHLEVNRYDLCDTPPEALACQGPLCNQVALNRAQLMDGTPSGAVFETGEAPKCGPVDCEADPWLSQNFIDGIVLRDSVADSLISARTPVSMQNIAAYANALVTATLEGNIRVLHGSFAANTGDHALSLHTGWVRSSLFLMPSAQDFLDWEVRQDVGVTHVISNDLTGAPRDASNYLSADVGFVDAQAPDYDLHLRPQAMAIDTAPEPANLYTDIEHKTRTVDVLARADQYGPADRGAYEFQDAGSPDPDPDPDPKPELLRDGFEEPAH